MKKLATIAAACGLTFAMSGCGVAADAYERHRLEQSWQDDLTSEDRAKVCIGYRVFPGLVATEIEQKGYSEDVVRDFLADECGGQA